ncbi:MAG: hypothetical protein CL920_08330 [Deltaproteobacteria bacterium]|nr:hypothetical protein [Deltaproteobacteria bacterium]|tara:strand:+ start:37115 stop:38521 length:1407 start_codon:yes stop_codon:yes gene_type:complete
MSKATPSPSIEVYQSTDIGRRRHENQDSMGYIKLSQIPYQDAHLLVVADGMGGASGGQVASSIAVREIVDYFQDDPNMEPDVALREAIELAASRILERAREEPSLTGMGTTCVCVLSLNGFVFAAHVGDSRIYLYRDGVLHRCTRDHSAVQRLVEAGILTEEEARNHPRQNVLSRVLGSEHPLYVELMGPPKKLLPGDRYILCSDGLHGEITDEKIIELVEDGPLDKITDNLVQAANDAGGNDNVTVQMLAFGESAPLEMAEEWQEFDDQVGGYVYYATMVVLLFAMGYLAGWYSHEESPARRQLAHNTTKRHVVHHPPAREHQSKPDERRQTTIAGRTPARRVPTQSRVRQSTKSRTKAPTRSMVQTRSKAPVARCEANAKAGSTRCVAPTKRSAPSTKPAANTRRTPPPARRTQPPVKRSTTAPAQRVAPAKRRTAPPVRRVDARKAPSSKPASVPASQPTKPPSR